MSEFTTLKSRYKLIDKVGIGGMSTVYVARDLQTNAIVAIKVLHPQFAINKNFLNRFFREIKIIATLNHPNILRLIDYGEVDGIPYFVTEYIQGKTLKELLNEGKKFSVKEAIRIIIDVLKALSHANKMGVVAHRDIKPGNIMIDKDGNVKLMDFGIAKLENTQITQDTIMFTPTYASPEQIKGENVDIRSDLYSVGTTFYELLTGRPPFIGNSTIDITLKHINEKPTPPSQFNKNIEKHLEDIVLKLLAKNPSDRFQKPEDVIRELEKIGYDKKFVSTKIENEYTLKGKSELLQNREKVYSFSIKPLYLLIIFIIFSIVSTLFFIIPKNVNNIKLSILQIITEPSEVEIYINDKFIGKSPIINYYIKPGEYKISFVKDGFERKEETIIINEKENKNLNIKLNSLKKEVDINIISIPPNANLYINENFIGTTPIVYKFIINNEYNLKLTKDGYENYQGKFVVTEDKKEIKISLKEKQSIVNSEPKTQTTQKVGFLNINTTPQGAKVLIDDLYKGETPLKISLNPGKYKVKLIKDNYLPYNMEIQIEENKTIDKNVALHPIEVEGLLTIHSFPEDAAVYLNGAFVGYTPLNKIKIKSGKYRLEIKLEGYVPYLTDFEIKSGEEKTFEDIVLYKLP